MDLSFAEKEREAEGLFTKENRGWTGRWMASFTYDQTVYCEKGHFY